MLNCRTAVIAVKGFRPYYVIIETKSFITNRFHLRYIHCTVHPSVT